MAVDAVGLAGLTGDVLGQGVVSIISSRTAIEAEITLEYPSDAGGAVVGIGLATATGVVAVETSVEHSVDVVGRGAGGDVVARCPHQQVPTRTGRTGAAADVALGAAGQTGHALGRPIDGVAKLTLRTHVDTAAIAEQVALHARQAAHTLVGSS